MSAEVILGIAETIWKNAEFDSPEMEAHFKQRYLEVVQGWSKEQAIAFALPYNCQIKKPKPPPGAAPKPKVTVTTSNMPEHIGLKGRRRRGGGGRNPRVGIRWGRPFSSRAQGSSSCGMARGATATSRRRRAAHGPRGTC